jgi:hypothetical protein
MNKKQLVFLVLIPVILLLALAGVALADGVEDPTDNWCYECGPWGDGRCSDANPDIANWYWTCGWWRAQVIKGAYADTDAPEMCFAPRRLVLLEFVNSDPTDDEEEEEEEQPPPPTFDATFNVGVNWCQYNEEAGGVQGNLTKINMTITNYVGTTTNINDVVRVVLTATEFTHQEWIASGSAGTNFTLFVPADYATITNGILEAYDGLGTKVGAATVGNASCSQRPPIAP